MSNAKDTPLSITTSHTVSCGIKLCQSWCSQHFFFFWSSKEISLNLKINKSITSQISFIRSYHTFHHRRWIQKDNKRVYTTSTKLGQRISALIGLPIYVNYLLVWDLAQQVLAIS